VYLDQLGRDFSANKVDFYSSAENRGLVEGVIGCIKGGAPLSIETSLRALQLGNSRVVGTVREYVDRFGALEHPEHGEYEVGLKHCVDARSAIINLVLSLRFNTIHERTAGSVVRNGGVFRVLSPLGRGFVSTHKSCGGEATAHELHTHGKRAEDPQIDHITDSIPHAVAIIEDPDRRSRWNARSQVVNAAAMLDSHSLGNEVHPTFENWGRWADRVVDLEWLSTNQPDPDNIFKALRATMVDIWTTALSRGITPEKQFSHAIIYYDPYRLGTINDPRSIFDAVVLFHPLGGDSRTLIARKMLEALKKRALDQGYSITFTDALVEKVVGSENNASFGGRAIQRNIQSEVEEALARKIIEGSLKVGDQVVIDASDIA
jgi:hypothetical protein